MSSCGCSATPCSCVDTSCDPAPQDPSCFRTLCDGNRANNVWVEGADAEGNSGICLLDTMELDQIIGVIQRDPQARIDLLKVTTNEYLQNLANTLPPLPTTNEGDDLQKQVNQNTVTPFYTIFKGQIPFNQ